LRAIAGGNAACWRVAGAIAGAAGVAAAAGLDAALSAVFSVVFSAVFSAVLGTTLRAIGRGLGNGTFGLAVVSFAKACDPRISATVVTIAVERKALVRAEQVTAFLFRRITKDQRP
jgi:phage tail tape-measure protein